MLLSPEKKEIMWPLFLNVLSHVLVQDKQTTCILFSRFTLETIILFNIAGRPDETTYVPVAVTLSSKTATIK